MDYCVCVCVYVYLNGSRAKHINTTMKTNRNVYALKGNRFSSYYLWFIWVWCARKYARTRSGAWCLFSSLRQKQSPSHAHTNTNKPRKSACLSTNAPHSIHVFRVPIVVDPLLIRPSYKSPYVIARLRSDCIVQPTCRRTYRHRVNGIWGWLVTTLNYELFRANTKLIRDWKSIATISAAINRNPCGLRARRRKRIRQNYTHEPKLPGKSIGTINNCPQRKLYVTDISLPPEPAV